jgi:hypothetical protein
MTKRTAEKPWTWAEIDRLAGAALRAFLLDYGDRGKVARVVAHHQIYCDGRPRAWRSCIYTHCELPCPIIDTPWRRDEDRHLACGEAAPLVYARMIGKLGRLPEGEDQ